MRNGCMSVALPSHNLVGSLFCPFESGARGSQISTTVPLPTLEMMSIAPPDWRAKPYTIDRPRPVPRRLPWW
jgi:hypothetical protein